MKPLSLLLTILSICLASALAIVGHNTLSAGSTDPIPEIAAQESSDRGPVRMIRFVLQEDGIYPRSMQIDKGSVNLALEDRTKGSEGLVIEAIADDQRTQVARVRRAEQHWRGRQLIRLSPGRYVVSDASQPEHRAELTVNP